MALRVDTYKKLMETVLKEAKKHKLYALVRLQDKMSDTVTITNGVTQAKQRSHLKGIGITLFAKDGSCAFGSTDILTEEKVVALVNNLKNTVKAAKKFGLKKNKEIFSIPKRVAKEVVPRKKKFGHFSLEQLEKKTLKLHKGTQALDKNMSVTSSYKEMSEHWWIMRSDGTSVRFTMPYARIFHSMVKKKKDKTQDVFVVLAGVDSSLLLEKKSLDRLAHRRDRAYDLLKGLLKANSLPSGHYKALLTSSFSGLLAHEAVGHAVESDAYPYSALGKSGKPKKAVQVSPKNISFVDGPVPGYWGDVRYSMNGIPRKTVSFIKDGKLVDSLSDVFSGREAGAPINGCGRAEYFYSTAIPRMSNTRIVDSKPLTMSLDPDYTSLDEIYNILVDMGELNKGEKVVMPVMGKGGMVSPESGTFMFNGAGIYLFENPKKITLYGASSFGGDILGAIKTRMKGIGKNLVLWDAGMCGKGGQGAPVSDGSHPFLFMDKTEAVTFGGQ